VNNLRKRGKKETNLITEDMITVTEYNEALIMWIKDEQFQLKQQDNYSRLISTPDNEQRIGPDRRFFRSSPIQQAISSKRTSGMIGSEKGKMELVPDSKSTIIALISKWHGL
jgi:hypothetical protein